MTGVWWRFVATGSAGIAAAASRLSEGVDLAGRQADVQISGLRKRTAPVWLRPVSRLFQRVAAAEEALSLRSGSVAVCVFAWSGVAAQGALCVARSQRRVKQGRQEVRNTKYEK